MRGEDFDGKLAEAFPQCLVSWNDAKWFSIKKIIIRIHVLCIRPISVENIGQLKKHGSQVNKFINWKWGRKEN